MMNKIKYSIKINKLINPEFIVAICSILNYTSIELHSLIAIILGCDLFVGGVKNIIHTKIFKYIDKLKDKHSDNEIKIFD